MGSCDIDMNGRGGSSKPGSSILNSDTFDMGEDISNHGL